MLQSHYASPFNFTQQSQIEAQQALRRLYGALALALTPLGQKLFSGESALDHVTQSLVEAYYSQLANDFNTPQALASLFNLTSHIYKLQQEGHNNLSGQFRLWPSVVRQ